MKLIDTITVTVDRKRYTLDHGTVAIVAARRSNARGASPRDNAFILRGLREEVAQRMGIDQRTAYAVLRSVKYSDLFV